jgi:hypothetical protein
LKNNILVALVVACALVVVANGASITDASFEQPPVPAQLTFLYIPSLPTGTAGAAGWTYVGRSGVAVDTFFRPPPPDGSQAAFLQQFPDEGSTLTSISQALTDVSSTSTLTVYAAERPGFLVNSINVYFSGVLEGTITPSSTAFTPFTFALSGLPSIGTLTFQSAAPSLNNDFDTAIDAVSLTGLPTPVPEPSALVSVALAVAALFFFQRRPRGAS